jgi:hypothetical protein
MCRQNTHGGPHPPEINLQNGFGGPKHTSVFALSKHALEDHKTQEIIIHHQHLKARRRKTLGMRQPLYPVLHSLHTHFLRLHHAHHLAYKPAASSATPISFAHQNTATVTTHFQNNRNLLSHLQLVLFSYTFLNLRMHARTSAADGAPQKMQAFLSVTCRSR